MCCRIQERYLIGEKRRTSLSCPNYFKATQLNIKHWMESTCCSLHATTIYKMFKWSFFFSKLISFLQWSVSVSINNTPRQVPWPGATDQLKLNLCFVGAFFCFLLFGCFLSYRYFICSDFHFFWLFGFCCCLRDKEKDRNGGQDTKLYGYRDGEGLGKVWKQESIVKNSSFLVTCMTWSP